MKLFGLNRSSKSSPAKVPMCLSRISFSCEESDEKSDDVSVVVAGVDSFVTFDPCRGELDVLGGVAVDFVFVR